MLIASLILYLPGFQLSLLILYLKSVQVRSIAFIFKNRQQATG